LDYRLYINLDFRLYINDAPYKQSMVLRGPSSSRIESNPYGVAQGLTLDPLLFLLYINDLWALTKLHAKTLMLQLAVACYDFLLYINDL